MIINSDERWYYINRAKQSRELAEAAASTRAAEVHLELRRRYLEKADETPLTVVA